MKIDRYTDLRASGKTRNQAASDLKISPHAAKKYENVYQTERTGSSLDETVPKFARHDAYVAILLRHGGFRGDAGAKARTVTHGYTGRRAAS